MLPGLWRRPCPASAPRSPSAATSIPARMVVKRYVRGKYACRYGHSIKSAPPPPGVIDKGKYEASVYAHVVTSKYGDHLPLHRLQGIFKRHGADISKQSMWDMLARFDEIAAQPILKEMRRQLLEESALQADETTVKVQLEGQKGTRRGVLWVWRNITREPGTRRSSRTSRTTGRPRAPMHSSGTGAGDLLTDGFDGVNPVSAQRNDIRRAGCWAHARRKFRDALQSRERRERCLVLRPIQRLFWIERAIVSRLKEGDDPDAAPDFDAN